jgi:hypothetical protein
MNSCLYVGTELLFSDTEDILGQHSQDTKVDSEVKLFQINLSIYYQMLLNVP